jgi:hypothetical protein
VSNTGEDALEGTPIELLVIDDEYVGFAQGRSSAMGRARRGDAGF